MQLSRIRRSRRLFRRVKSVYGEHSGDLIRQIVHKRLILRKTLPDRSRKTLVLR